MSSELMPKETTYQIEVFLAEESGKKWYFAVSDDLPSFLAHGPTIGVLRDRVKDTVLGLLSSKNEVVRSVDVTPRDREIPPSSIITHSLVPKGAVPYKSAITVHASFSVAA